MAPLDEARTSADTAADHVSDHNVLHVKANYVFTGAGTPESSVSAIVGSTYHRTDGGTGTTFYVKESGSGNTGWVAQAAGGGATPAKLYEGATVRIDADPAIADDINFYKGDGSTISFLWDETDGQWEFSTDIDMLDNDITDVNRIYGTTSGHQYLRAGASNLGTLIEDFTGQTRFTIAGSDTGDVFFQALGGSVTLMWDESDGRWEFTTEVDMGTNKIIGLVDPTTDQDAATKKYVDDNIGGSHTIASHSDTTGTGAELDTLTDGSETTLHSHAGGGGDPLTTKGDIMAYNTDADRVPIGTNDHVLTADSTTAFGLKWAAAPAAAGGMPVAVVAGNVTVSAAGIWIISSDAALRTVTLPLISATGSDGMRIIIKREGSNFVDIDCAGSDEFEPGSVTTQRLFTDWSALSLVANTSANYWYELGYFGSIT